MSSYGDTNTSPNLEWFAIAVKPRFDKAVARMLGVKGFQTFLPLYKKRHIYAARSREADLPLFPGYVFCRFDIQHRLPILTTPGVLHILCIGNSPAPISATEIFSLQTAMRAQLPVQPCPYLQAGERVRIERGVLAGVEGIVIDVRQGIRLVLSVALLQRSVLLEVDREMVRATRTPFPVMGDFLPETAAVLESQVAADSLQPNQGD